MADYGKLCHRQRTRWNDRELLLRLFQRRVLQGFGEKPPPWDAVWRAVSVTGIDGTYTLDFLLDASLMRPRYLIRVFEMARRRAVTLGRDQIEEPDYKAGLSELGWQVLEDFDRELTESVVPDARIVAVRHGSKLGERTSLTKLKGVIARKVGRTGSHEVRHRRADLDRMHRGAHRRGASLHLGLRLQAPVHALAHPERR